jgi:hypothetical protein
MDEKVRIHRPAEEVVLWVELGTAIHLKAVSGIDPVELNITEARAVAAKLLELADELERS